MTVQLRPYQKDACRNAYNKLFREGEESGVICLPTGGGKTFTAAVLVNLIRQKHGYNILWFAHREELIKQAIEAFQTVSPSMKLTTWCANKIKVNDEFVGPSAKDATGDAVFCMIKSSRRLPEQLKAIKAKFGTEWILVVDEAHHYALPKDHVDSKTYRSEYIQILREKIEKMGLVPKRIGLTATPERMDERPLAFNQVLHDVKFIDLVKQGHLARPIYYEMRTTENFGKLDIRMGDYTAQSLRRLNTPKRNGAIVQEYVKHKDKYGKTLVFACDVAHAHELQRVFKAFDKSIPIEVITGSYSKDDRRRVKEWLDEGSHKEPKVLINCMVYTEGFDCPSLNSIFLARPTVSRSLWMQMVGRGARVVNKKVFIPKDYLASAPLPGEYGPVELADGRIKKFHILKHDETGAWVYHPIKKTFNLVNITDNITNYSTLVHEWTMDIRVDQEAESFQVDKNKKYYRKKRRKKAQELLNKYAKIQAGGLEEARLVDVQSVLIFSTLFQDRIGIPLDQDRLDCIRKLKEYCGNCWTKVTSPFKPDEEELIFDQGMFQQSYSFCVPANEFPLPLWTKLSWAYYWRYIVGKKTVPMKKKNPADPNEPVRIAKAWSWISFMNLRDPEVISAARERVKRDLEIARQINAEFNTKFANKIKVHELFTACYNRAMSNKSIKPSTKSAISWLLKQVQGIAAKDRRLTVTTKINIQGNSDPKMGQMYKFRMAMSDAMQGLLNDSSCQVVCVTQSSRLTPKGLHSFVLNEKKMQDKRMGDEQLGKTKKLNK